MQRLFRRLKAPCVRVVKRADRKHLVLRWRDPRTGLTRERATKAVRRRDAEREAALLAEVLAGEREQEIIGWAKFRERFEQERLALGRPRSAAAWKTAANHLEDLLDQLKTGWEREPTLYDVDADVLSQLAATLRAAGKRPTPVATYVRSLRVSLNWAEGIFPGYQAPRLKMPRRKQRKLMRGRPITTEEFERMLAAVPRVLARKPKGKDPIPAPPERVESIRYLLRGLWLSGLRLDEALRLDWSRQDRLHIHRIDHRRPMMRIRAEGEKGAQDRLLPITPDFVAFLRMTPPGRRRGAVFVALASRGPITSSATASRLISLIGQEAKVVVDVDERGRKKFASAHDLRRSFGERWAPKVMPIILKELMRHESIDTTMRYYVGANAERTANAIWEAFGDQTGDKALDQEETSKNPTT